MPEAKPHQNGSRAVIGICTKVLMLTAFPST